MKKTKLKTIKELKNSIEPGDIFKNTNNVSFRGSITFKVIKRITSDSGELKYRCKIILTDSRMWRIGQEGIFTLTRKDLYERL